MTRRALEDEESFRVASTCGEDVDSFRDDSAGGGSCRELSKVFKVVWVQVSGLFCLDPV